VRSASLRITPKPLTLDREAYIGKDYGDIGDERDVLLIEARKRLAASTIGK